MQLNALALEGPLLSDRRLRELVESLEAARAKLQAVIYDTLEHVKLTMLGAMAAVVNLQTHEK